MSSILQPLIDRLRTAGPSRWEPIAQAAGVAKTLPRKLVVLGCLSLAGYAPSVSSQDAYPSKPIRVIVPFSASGGLDIVARLIGQKLSESLKTPVVIDNRPGAGGNLGAQIAVQAQPDGYTLLFCNITNAVYPSMFRARAYDPQKDLVPINLAISFPYVLSVPPSMPVRSIDELVDYAKRRTDYLTYGSSGVGTPPHFAGVLMSITSGLRLQHVPYGGNPDAQRDLLGGRLDMLFINTANALPLMRSGKVRGLAVSSLQRSELVPALPTLAESGYPGFDMNSWAGFCAPAHTPSHIVSKLNAEFMRILRLPDIREKLIAQGFEIPALPPAEFRAFFQVEIDKYARLVREANIKPQ